MTLISIYNSDGLVGRCDARCYDAKHPDCVCICGGMNHGGGKQKAIDNITEHVKNQIRENYKPLAGRDPQVEVKFYDHQLNLF